MARQGMRNVDFGMIDRLRLGWRLLRDPRIPAARRLLPAVVAVIYLLSPIDAIPDFLLGFGQVDDIGVIALALAAVGMLTKWSPREIVAEHAADLGIIDEPDYGTPHRPPARAGKKGEPIEAKYWVDDWK